MMKKPLLTRSVNRFTLDSGAYGRLWMQRHRQGACPRIPVCAGIDLEDER